MGINHLNTTLFICGIEIIITPQTSLGLHYVGEYLPLVGSGALSVLFTFTCPGLHNAWHTGNQRFSAEAEHQNQLGTFTAHQHRAPPQTNANRDSGNGPGHQVFISQAPQVILILSQIHSPCCAVLNNYLLNE